MPSGPRGPYSASSVSEATIVKRSADLASGAVTARQNASKPSSKPRATRAASGSRTITLRYSSAVPRPRTARAARAARPPEAAPGTRSGGAAASAGGSGHPVRLLDLGHQPAGRVEELGRHGGPTAEVLDREQHRRGREALGVDQRRDHRSIPLRRVAPLRLRRGQEGQERLGLLRVLG